MGENEKLELHCTVLKILLARTTLMRFPSSKTNPVGPSESLPIPCLPPLHIYSRCTVRARKRLENAMTSGNKNFDCNLPAKVGEVSGF